jgi:acyl-CoA synthetase (AMP-forming)/AMP-acid ligase II
MALRTIACALDRVASRAPLSLALLVPEQGISLTYTELSVATRTFASGLSKWGVRSGDVIVSDLPNTSENLTLQLAAARVGASVATVKNSDALHDLVSAVDGRGGRVSGCVSSSSESFLNAAGAALPLGAVSAGSALDALMYGTTDAEAAVAEAVADVIAPSSPMAYWGSLEPLTHAEALSLGAAAAAELALQPSDRVCVAITLCHSFGIGSACTGALLSGAAIVLPAVGGIRGCGVPEERATVTLRVLAAQRCSVLFADTHTLKAFESIALVEARQSLDLSAMRAGVCKVGSGVDWLDPTVEFAGIKLRTLGKK